MDQSQLQAFRDNTNGVYDKIRGRTETARQNGFIADPVITNKTDIYVVAFGFGQHIHDGVSNLSEELADNLPAVFFSPPAVHSTIRTIDLGGEEMSEELEGDIKNRLMSLAANASGLEISYGPGIIDSGSVILPAEPNDQTIETISSVNVHFDEAKIPGKTTWGSHMTILRLSTKTGPEAVATVTEKLGNTEPLGAIKPASFRLIRLQFDAAGLLVSELAEVPLPA